MSEKIFLTRNQLAKFLPTPEAIKAFENLFKIATQQTPNNLDEVQISAESALSMANYSLSVLDNVSKLIEALELQPPETPTISEDIIDIPIVNINECECLEIIKEPDWNFIKNHPTTIAGYGITDAYSAVVADAPLTGSGTTSSHLSIPAATSLANGYLSSTDWNTFNSKEPAQTKGNITESTSSVLTITNGSNSTVGPNVTIQVKQATNAVSGYLSSTDWTTFNGKQAAYTNLTSIGGLANSSGWLKNNGSGTFSYSTPTATDVGLGNVTNNAQVKAITSTANKLVKFSDTSSTITNSVIYDNGTNVGISTSSPAVKCDVSGQIRASSGILFGTDTLSANALDDYEEGTFTATLTGSTSGTYPVTGAYTKIGNLVTIFGFFNNIGINSSLVGNIIVTGLPFNARLTSSCSVFINWSETGHIYKGQIAIDTAVLYIRREDGVHQDNINFNNADVGTYTDLTFTGTYTTN